VRHVIAAAAFGLGSAPALAQTPAQDVQCLVASNIFAQAEKDAKKRQVASMATVFYLGRVDARLSGAQLKASLAEQAKAVNAQTVGGIMTSCAKSMQGKMAALQAVSQQVGKETGSK